jgi:hypothetical protein
MGVQCGQVVVAWLEHPEVLELGHQRQDHLLPNVGHLFTHPRFRWTFLNARRRLGRGMINQTTQLSPL